MSRSHRIYFPVAALLIAGMSCDIPAMTAKPDPGAVNTSAAQTVDAMLAQITSQVVFSPTLEFTSTFTYTAEVPSLTPTETIIPTQSLTPTQIFTATREVPLMSVSIPTNCRNGPGKVYVWVGALLVGESAEVFGRDPTNNYWYIRNPDPGPEFCWAWGEYATLTGPVLLLPVFTPPPTPTPTMTPTPSPAFSARYSGLDTCTVNWWIEIKLKNTGPIPLRSVDIIVEDMVTSVKLENLSDGFTNIDGCLNTTTKDKLDPGDTYLLSAPAFGYDLTGHKLHVIITLCSDTGQKGLCVKNKFDFTP